MINPRKSVVQTDRRRLSIGAAAAASVLMAGLAYGGVQWRVSSLENQIAATQDDLTRLKAAVTGANPRWGEFGEWNDLNIDWLSRVNA